MAHPEFLFAGKFVTLFFRIPKLKRLFSISISLLFHFPSSSFWRQKEGKTVYLHQGYGRQVPADAASPKKKNPSVAPAKLAPCVLGIS
jgi:hypothetical protein